MSTLSVSDVTNHPLDQPPALELEAIFRAHYQLTYRTAYAVTGSAADAEDVVQTIFLRLLRREFPPDMKKNPGAYLYRAAVNVSLNSIRGTKRRTLAMERARQENSPIEQSDSAEEIHRRLYDAVAQLDPQAAR
jgi:RNA polymerase sigma-70 factor (ECF subfamily)